MTTLLGYTKHVNKEIMKLKAQRTLQHYNIAIPHGHLH